jgi:hypothetical protein
VGWAGAYLYSGLWFAERAQRALAASLFIGNGFFICRLAYGHIDFVPFLALPLALWVLHQAAARAESQATKITAAIAMLLLGCLFAIVIDGSPVAIIHWLFWVALYSFALSWARRSLLPAVTFALAGAIAGVLDAGYLWPMILAQADFPRRTADTFTGPWSLLWFILIPMRGKFLPAYGKGLELSVFIGPVLFYLIWRFRRALFTDMPASIKAPLIVVSIVSIWLGMGSLHVLHVPVWLSPFDWLRPLPGFRSIGVTGRYWGFLALPLSLLAASALWRFLHSAERDRHWGTVLGAAFLFQIVFQTQSLLAVWLPARYHAPIAFAGLFDGGLESIMLLEYPHTIKPHHQGEYITPKRAVINCYNMDDFMRAEVQPGTKLIKEVNLDKVQGMDRTSLQAGFLTWNHIRIIRSPTAAPSDTTEGAQSVVRIVLNQAYHKLWRTPDCAVERGATNNLVAACSAERLRKGPIDLTFYDPISELGMRTSCVAWIFMGAVLVLLSLIAWLQARPPSPNHS